MSPREKLKEASRLEAEAARLRKEAFDQRPLPDFWRVGQEVRLLNNKEWAYDAGTVAKIVQVRDPETPAAEYQVFWISKRPATERFWTTPDEVELVNDVEPPHDP